MYIGTVLVHTSLRERKKRGRSEFVSAEKSVGREGGIQKIRSKMKQNKKESLVYKKE